jgi:hypothetical protein
MQEENDNLDKFKYDIDNLNIKLEKELIDTLNCFMNELELVFEYVNNIDDLRKYIKLLTENKQELQKFIKDCLENLKDHEEKIYNIMYSKKKIKSLEFNFLNEIKLFNSLLDFSVFKDENKNTKKTIVKYIYTIYTSCFILNFGMVSNEDNGGIIKEDDLLSFVSNLTNKLKIQEESQVEKVTTIGHHRGPHSGYSRDIISNSKNKNIPRSDNDFDFNMVGSQILSGGLGDLNGLGNIFQSLMSNNEIMNIAADLSKDIKEENIDPMVLLSSIMSGKPNDKLNKLVSNITNKIETKINNGEINKDELEEQAQSIMNSVKFNNS